MEEFVLFKALALFSPDEVDLSKTARDDVSRKRLDILKYMRKVSDRETESQRDTETLRQKDRETERKRKREKERQRQGDSDSFRLTT